MPELPEVETTLRGIDPYLTGASVASVTLRERRLRWPIDANLAGFLGNKVLNGITRRAKYLLFNFSGAEAGILLIHLGMSGSLRLVNPDAIPRKHDHLDILFNNNWVLRFHDPRRFGAVLWEPGDINQHKLLKHLGPEPLINNFNGDYLFGQSRSRKLPVKQFLMDNKVVVGVGNIYANEALFRSGISPKRQAGSISKARYRQLTDNVKQVLSEAIDQGGTTLRDFVNGDGQPGYFKQRLQVYGRGGQPCRVCDTPLSEIKLGQRSTVYCRNCQR